MKVHIVETADRYLIVNAETGEEMEPDGVGFSYQHSASEYAVSQGWEVVCTTLRFYF